MGRTRREGGIARGQAPVRPPLRKVLQHSAPEDVITVVIRLVSDDLPPDLPTSERADFRKQGFQRNSAAIRGTLDSLGADIVGEAWLDHSLRVNVPASAVGVLRTVPDVASLSLPTAYVLE